jgi:hypothetical protein
MEAIFTFSWCAIKFMGYWLSVLLIVLLPLYVFGFLYWRGKVKVSGSKVGLLLFIVSILLSIFLVFVFSVTTIVLGGWC